MFRERIVGAIVGAVLGDVVGVPFEFLPPELVDIRLPLERLPKGGYHGMEPGVWSDDSSLLLATADVLSRRGLDLEETARAFLEWYLMGAYTSTGVVFDIGNTTSRALERLRSGVPPWESGLDVPSCGSLMRILPVSLYTVCDPLEEALEWAHRFSRITHSHPLAETACGLYTVVVRGLVRGLGRIEAVTRAGEVLRGFYGAREPYRRYTGEFGYLLDPAGLAGREYRFRDGREACYAPKTLEAAVWAFLRGGSLLGTIVRAVRLGYDTDTVASVAGGLAGAYHGLEGVPHGLVEQIRGARLLMDIAERLAGAVAERCGPAAGEGL